MAFESDQLQAKTKHNFITLILMFTVLSSILIIIYFYNIKLVILVYFYFFVLLVLSFIGVFRAFAQQKCSLSLFNYLFIYSYLHIKLSQSHLRPLIRHHFTRDPYRIDNICTKEMEIYSYPRMRFSQFGKFFYCFFL